MQFTYKIENYYPYESRVFVVYTPTDTSFEPLGGWVSIGVDWTSQQIKDAVVSSAPLVKWTAQKSSVVQALLGVEDSGVAVPPPPEPTPPEPVLPPPPTPEEVAASIQASVVWQTQQRLDSFARTRNYDGILSACTYASSLVPKFKAEADYCVAKRDETWAALYDFMSEVQAGTKPFPTGYADIEPLLPVLSWPV